jgi:hypothetical protein
MLGPETMSHASNAILLIRLLVRLNDTCSVHGVQNTKRAAPQPDNVLLLETDVY